MKQILVVMLLSVMSLSQGVSIKPSPKIAPKKIQQHHKRALKATATAHSTTLAWIAPNPTGCTQSITYNVYSGATAGGEDYTNPIKTGLSVLTYVDSNVVALQTKFYTVKSNCASNTVPLSISSNETSGTTPPDNGQSNPPTGVTATSN